tara:strand:- start:122 stop:787 length:666 start_codon:yes stop_codon:yes gene_type:complete
MELNPTWNNFFINLPIQDIYQKIKKEAYGKTIYPPENQILNAFNLFEPQKLKVIIIGQDPYHRPGQANGLSFSVNKDINIPRSLKNIFEGLKFDIGCNMPEHGDLTKWAEQGVLLLNSVLTVYEGIPNDKTHKKLWNPITDTLIERLSKKLPNLVFILWGNNAKDKKKFILNPENHLILEGCHPSPFNNTIIQDNFYKKRFFSNTNKYLIENNKNPIEWEL